MPLDQAGLHALIEACVRDRMRARPYPVEPALIRRAICLEPLPPRTDLAVQHHGSADGEDWVRRSVSFESQPGVRVPALAYTPRSDGQHPLVVVAADSGEPGRTAPWLQALGISLAIQGFVVVILDPPGTGGRAEMGDPYDLSLSAAITPQALFAWDLIRAIDLAHAEYGTHPEKVAALGVGFGGEAALLSAAIDDRISALVLSGAPHCQESGLSDTYRMLPGVADLGDWANLLVHRAPMPFLLFASELDAQEQIEESARKLKGTYKGKQSELLRVETFPGERDLSRRMRESVAAFLFEHLRSKPHRAYVAEPLPLTDGVNNPRSANTEEPLDLALSVGTSTFQELRNAALTLPYPMVSPDLVPWGKYGRLEPLPELETLHLSDHGDSPEHLALPHIDARLLVPLGLSVPDFYAQMLHLLLPGGPEGWEPLAMQGDALTAMIASVRTLMKKAEAKIPPKLIVAQGPVSSLAARLLGQMRLGLAIELSHEPRSWQEVLDQGILVPGARYRVWPWPAPSMSPSPPEGEPVWDEGRLAVEEHGDSEDPDSFSPSPPSPLSPSGGEGEPEDETQPEP